MLHSFDSLLVLVLDLLLGALVLDVHALLHRPKILMHRLLDGADFLLVHNNLAVHML